MSKAAEVKVRGDWVADLEGGDFGEDVDGMMNDEGDSIDIFKWRTGL